MAIHTPTGELVKTKEHSELNKMFDEKGVTVRKNEETLGRLPKQEEIGTEMTTFIRISSEEFDQKVSEGYLDVSHKTADGGVLVVESRRPITENSVISRNGSSRWETETGEIIYNEWPQTLNSEDGDNWMTRYGVAPNSTEFAPYKKQATIKVLPVNDEIIQMLGGNSGDSSVKIWISWADDGMDIYLTGYITDQGYGLAGSEFEEKYEPIDENEDNKLGQLRKAKSKISSKNVPPTVIQRLKSLLGL